MGQYEDNGERQRCDDMSRLDKPTGMRDDGYDDGTDGNGNETKTRRNIKTDGTRRASKTIDNENETDDETQERDEERDEDDMGYEEGSDGGGFIITHRSTKLNRSHKTRIPQGQGALFIFRPTPSRWFLLICGP